MYLIRHFFSTPPLSGGVFVDVGAMDGVTHSNTKALEEAYEWHGVCIEPSPPNYDKLVQVRPQCRNFNAAVCQEAGRTTIYGEVSVNGALQSFTSQVDCRTFAGIGGQRFAKYEPAWRGV